MYDSLFNPSSKGCNVYMSVIKNGVGLTTTTKRNTPTVFKKHVTWKSKCDELERLSGRRNFLEFDISIAYLNSSFLVINQAAGIDLSWHSKMWEATISRNNHPFQMWIRPFVPSDFASWNTPECSESRCLICNCNAHTEDSVVKSVSLQDVLVSKVNKSVYCYIFFLPKILHKEDKRKLRYYINTYIIESYRNVLVQLVC